MPSPHRAINVSGVNHTISAIATPQLSSAHALSAGFSETGDEGAALVSLFTTTGVVVEPEPLGRFVLDGLPDAGIDPVAVVNGMRLFVAYDPVHAALYVATDDAGENPYLLQEELQEVMGRHVGRRSRREVWQPGQSKIDFCRG